MAALPPLENVCGIERLSPAGKYLEAATAPICQNVGRKPENAKKKKKMVEHYPRFERLD
jgi:hypothetical protein